MSLFCSISGQPPLHPVLSQKSGHVYEKDLVVKYLKDNDGRDPITGEALAEDDLIDIKTAPSTPAAPPRPPTFTSVPALLHVLQGEWDATMLECLELRKAGAELRQELSHALYKEDAAMRVLARVTRERDEAREALASVKATLGPAFSSGGAEAAGDVEMDAAPQESGLPEDVLARVQETTKTLSAGRKKRKPAAGYATSAELKTYTQIESIPSLHTTKPPGVSALDLVSETKLFVTGGLDKSVQVYDRATSKIVCTLKGHTKKVTAVLATKGLNAESRPNMLISSSLDKSVRVWTPNGNKTVYGASGNLATSGEVNALALHPSETLVASASSDGTWSLHDLASDKPKTITTISLPADVEPETANTAIAFHPDGSLLGVGSSDSMIRVFDIVAGACVATFPGHSESSGGAITSLSFSENGYTLASSAQDSTEVKIWDLRKLSNAHTIALGANAKVSTVQFDESAQFLAVGGTDLRVYANKTWEELLVVEENAGEITGVAWGGLGKEVAVSSVDRTVRFIGTAQAE